MNMSLEEAALGIYRVAVARIADLIRKVTVERGLDPREFTLQSFGGSGGLFAGSYARELGIQRVVVPETAAVLCAFGMVAADVLHDISVVRPMPMPSDPEEINNLLRPIAHRALRELQQEGFPAEKVSFEWVVEMRYGRQVHQVSTPLRGQLPVTAPMLTDLQNDFEQLYERRYGRGSSYRAAGIELVTFRLKARGLMGKPRVEPAALGSTDASDAERGMRSLFDAEAGEMKSLTVYDLERMAPGNVVRGPTVVHSSITTIVVHRGQIAHMDGLRNLILEPA
jgi:N-methylhydantoinase A